MIAIKNFSAVVLAAILLTKIHSYPQAQMIEKTRAIHQLAWEVRDNSNRVASSKEQAMIYQKTLETFESNSNALAKQLVQAGDWKTFSDYYKTLDDAGKQNLEFVVQGIISRVFLNENSTDFSLNSQEYFPGYGYANLATRTEEVKRLSVSFYMLIGKMRKSMVHLDGKRINHEVKPGSVEAGDSEL